MRRTTDTGSAGAFLVGAQLARRGWPVSVTYGNTARTDLLAQVGERLLPAAIQVKTKGERSGVFQLRGVTEPSPDGANEWVVLVARKKTGADEFFVVPRNHVCGSVVAVMYNQPKNQRGGLGAQEFESYRDEWGLMEMPAQEVKWRVPEWVYRTLDGMDWSHRPPPEKSL